MSLHDDLIAHSHRLPTDYREYGGGGDRWSDPAEAYPDCSSGCRHASYLRGALSRDWCICLNPAAPRFGLLTFEHQAGFGCFEPKKRG